MDADPTAVIDAVVRDRFPTGQIDAILVHPDVDEDGDRVLVITVVYDPDWGDLDRSRTVSLARHLRHRLDECGVVGFPIISFVSKPELADRTSAAA